MTIDEIRKKAPVGATHYCNMAGEVRYLKIGIFGITMVYWRQQNCWTQFKVYSPSIKPL